MSDSDPMTKDGRVRLSLLVLTDELADFLWYQFLLFRLPALAIEVIWCPEISATEDLIRNTRFDGIIWDTRLSHGDPVAFLQYLTIVSGDRPVVAIGSDSEETAASAMLDLGAADYLCRGHLERWGLGRALGSAWYRYQSRQMQSETLALEVAPGFINRNLFFERLRQGLRRAAHNQTRLALLQLDVDDFSAVNESVGYQGADSLLVRLAERLREAMRHGDSLIRIGGDELAVIVEPVTDQLEVVQLVQMLLERLGRPFAVEGHNLLVTISVGVVLFPDGGTTPEQLLRQAGRALAEAKRDAGNSYHFYSQRLHDLVDRQVELEADLRQALRGNRLDLHFQPRIEIATGRVLGVECLLRWQDPKRGTVPPDVMIPAAERSGLIVPIGYWVIEQACARMLEAAELGMGELVFAVNLSFRQFHDRRMTETIFRIIYNAGIDTRLLELELTESAMMHDPDYAQRCLRSLNRLGISFALDDFGTGFSSLSNLHHLPIALVKVDKSFVQGIGRARDAEHIVRAIISLSHSLGMTVVAEGVETETQLDFLRQAGCDQVQGFYFARPMPWEQVVDYLGRHPLPTKDRESL